MIRTHVTSGANVRPTTTPSAANAFATSTCGRPASKKTKFACDSVRRSFSESSTACGFTRHPLNRHRYVYAHPVHRIAQGCRGRCEREPVLVAGTAYALLAQMLG